MSEGPDELQDAPGGTAGEASADGSGAEEQKRRFREALERKRGAQHPSDAVRGGEASRGRSGAAKRQEFRRKSG